MTTICEIISALESSRVSTLGATPPNVPGLLATSLTDAAKLMVQEKRLRGTIYIGRTKDICKRAMNQHFKTGATDRSTLRRTLGAILRDQLSLVAIPTKSNRTSKPFNDYVFDSDGEERLTKWMECNLLISWSPVNCQLQEKKKSVIKAVKPPLCLQFFANPYKSAIKEYIRYCVTEAKAAK